MKTLTLKNVDTKDCIELRADDQRIHSYKDFIKDIKIGDHVTYADNDTMWWRTGLVIKIVKSPKLKPLKTKGKMPVTYGMGKKI